MKKFYFNAFAALTAMCGWGGLTASADNVIGNGTVKMTYVDYSVPDSVFGVRDTIRAGYNKAAAVGAAIGFGNTGWNENKIGVLRVDVSSVPGTIQKATLRAKISGSSDSKRKTSWGVALVDKALSVDTLSYNKDGKEPISKLLNGGNQVGSAKESATIFDEASFDVTEALSSGQTAATFYVYETAAAGGYLTEPVLEVEYEPFEATTKTIDFEDGEKVFTDDSRITGAIEDDATLGSKVLGWTCANNAQNGYSFSHYDFSGILDKPALVAVEFDYYNTNGGRAIFNIGDADVRGNTGGSSKTTYNSTGVIFRIGSDKNNFYINDNVLLLSDKSEMVKVWDEAAQDYVEEEQVTPGFTNKWLHVSTIINNDAKMVYWVVTDQEGKVLHEGNGAFYAADANKCSQVDLFGYINNSHCAMLDNLTITNYKSNAVFADYTVKYVDADGNEIKDARTSNGQAGKFVTLLESDKTAVTKDDVKYLYDSDNSETVAINENGTAVITVKFRQAEKYYAVLNCMVSGGTGVANRLAQFQGNDLWFWEGDTYTLYPSRAYKHTDGAYYVTSATNYNGVSFSFPGSIVPAKQAGKTYYIGTLYYNKVDSIAYYSDFEHLALPTVDEGNGTGLGQLVGTVNSWFSFSGGYFDRFSGGRGIRLDADSYVYTEPIAEDATYKVTIYGRNDVSSETVDPYYLGVRDANGKVSQYADLSIPSWGSAVTGSSVVENVALKAGESLVVMNDNADKKVSLDDISLTKTGDYVAPNLVTAIKNVETVKADDAIYTLTGVKVNGAVKPGLYIRGGKTILVK